MEECIDSSKSTVPAIQAKSRFVVMQPTYNHGIVKQIKLEHDLTTFLFIKQGKSQVEVNFERDAYNPEEFANVNCIVDNTQCTKDIDKITVKLYRDIIAFSRDGAKYTDSSVVTKRSYTGVTALTM
jgi:hypothetical protein